MVLDYAFGAAARQFSTFFEGVSLSVKSQFGQAAEISANDLKQRFAR
jgi:hypothetical protein